MRIFEINTWVWLSDLSERYGRSITLETVPAQEWDAILPYCFDAVWLMGVWQRSPEGRVIAQRDPRLLDAGRSALGDFRVEDVVASPYCVHSYIVEERLGGRAGLATARAQLAQRNLKLILDFVPNHTALDHVWTLVHPEYYVKGTVEALRREPQRYFCAEGDLVLARGATGRTCSEVWTDTAQLDASCPGYREAAVLTLLEIASQCDGVRCDMAMLMLNQALAANWGVEALPPSEFWVHVIEAVRGRYPNLLFIAESYGDTEWILQRQGFDYCYDKDKLYERLAYGDAESVRQHVRGCSPEFLAGLVHFLENHDEAPAADCFRPSGRHRLAAMAIATLPGASLWYDRQFEGRFGKLAVQIGRSQSIRDYYKKLLRVTAHPAIRDGHWSWCRVEPSSTILAWSWTCDESRLLVVLNLSDGTALGQVTLPWDAMGRREYSLRDLMTGDNLGPFDCLELAEHGLAMRCASWDCHLFEVVLV